MANELVLAKRSEILALNPDDPRVEGLLYNLKQGGGLSLADIPKIKNPSGGSLMFELNIPSREPEYVKDLVGIILFQSDRRTLWGDKSIGSGEKPVCESKDLIKGSLRKNAEGGLDVPEKILKIAMPGGEKGECVGCPFAEFDTAVDGNGKPSRGQACSQSKVIFFLRTGDVLPIQITVPSGSLTALRQSYATFPVRVDKCIMRVSLAKEKSKTGVDFAQYRFEYLSALDKETVEALGEYGKMLTKVFESAVASRDSVRQKPPRGEPQGKTGDTF